jgi:hypothetical protein
MQARFGMTRLQRVAFSTGLSTFVLVCAATLYALPTFQQETSHTNDSPMVRMQRSFAAAKPAKPENLLGTWVAVKEVSTEKFLTGRIGADHVEADESGIRRGEPGQSTVGRPRSILPGHPLDWKLTFRKGGERIQAVSETPWEPTGDTSDVTFDSGGDFIFEKDYGGDAMWVYRCRAADLRRIVCLFKNADGHGVEFRKVTDRP